jgi:hypothetical protein
MTFGERVSRGFPGRDEGGGWMEGCSLATMSEEGLDRSRGDSWIAVSDVGRVSGVTRMVSLDTLEGVLTLLEKIGDVRFALLTEDEGPADIGGC